MCWQSSDEMFVKNLRRWLVPFLQRCEKQKPGCFNELICEYLVTMAKDDLSRCLKVFESSKANVSINWFIWKFCIDKYQACRKIKILFVFLSQINSAWPSKRKAWIWEVNSRLGKVLKMVRLAWGPWKSSHECWKSSWPISPCNRKSSNFPWYIFHVK